MNIKITGGTPLSGTIAPSGSKNSAVALIPASILFQKFVLENVPDITDVARLIKILEKLGSKINWDKTSQKLTIDNSHLTLANIGQKDLGNMRGTSLLWGPMLARFGQFKFKDLPGGCTLGARPLDPHYQAFRDLGITIDDKNGIKMNALNAKSGEIWLSEMSPTVTENVIMLATSLPGTTRISGAACEPQVQDLCQMLTKAGISISGIGSNIIEITGAKLPADHIHKIWDDHYEISTFLALGAATGGQITVRHTLHELLAPIWYQFAQFGIKLKHTAGSTTVLPHQLINQSPSTVRAQPWPALPVDLLPIFIPLALKTRHSHVLFHNWMYEAGLYWTPELTKLGAEIVVCDPHRVMVMGGKKLHGATLEAPYIIRAVVSMAMCAMIAHGQTTILNADTLYRGHPKFADNLKKLGAKIEEI